MGKSTIFMVIFNSYVWHNQRVTSMVIDSNMRYPMVSHPHMAIDPLGWRRRMFAGTHGVHMMFLHFNNHFLVLDFITQKKIEKWFWQWKNNPQQFSIFFWLWFWLWKVMCSRLFIFHSKILATTRCSSVVNQEPQICECPRTVMSWPPPAWWADRWSHGPLTIVDHCCGGSPTWWLPMILKWNALDPMFWVKWSMEHVEYFLEIFTQNTCSTKFLGPAGVSRGPIWNAWAYSENGGNLHTLVNSWWKVQFEQFVLYSTTYPR